jgi:hypothetical protein
MKFKPGKQPRIHAGLLLLFFFAEAVASMPNTIVVVPHGYYTGNSYRALPEEVKKVYVAGVIDGILYSPVFGGDQESIGQFKACMAGMNSSQIGAIVNQYLEANPQDWDNDMNNLIDQAMRKACLLRGRKYK